MIKDPANMIANATRETASERRKELRLAIPWECIEYLSHDDPDKKSFMGMVINSSKSGLCMTSIKQLSVGQRLRIISNIPGHSRTAIVCWAEYETVTFCRCGLKFIE